MISESSKRNTAPSKPVDQEGQEFDVQFLRPGQPKIATTNDAKLVILTTFAEPPVPVGFSVRQGFNERLKIDLLKISTMRAEHRTLSLRVINEDKDTISFKD